MKIHTAATAMIEGGVVLVVGGGSHCHVMRVPTGSRPGMWQSFKGLMLLKFGAGRCLINLVCVSGIHLVKSPEKSTQEREGENWGVMRFEFYSIQVDKWDLLFVPLFG